MHFSASYEENNLLPEPTPGVEVHGLPQGYRHVNQAMYQTSNTDVIHSCYRSYGHRAGLRFIVGRTDGDGESTHWIVFKNLKVFRSELEICVAEEYTVVLVAKLADLLVKESLQRFPDVCQRIRIEIYPQVFFGVNMQACHLVRERVRSHFVFFRVVFNLPQIYPGVLRDDQLAIQCV